MGKETLRIALLLIVLPVQPATPQDPGPDETTVCTQIARIKKQAEPKWQRIPWVASLSEARRLSQSEQRPVFLFTYDGNLDIGRC